MKLCICVEFWDTKLLEKSNFETPKVSWSKHEFQTRYVQAAIMVIKVNYIPYALILFTKLHYFQGFLRQKRKKSSGIKYLVFIYFKITKIRVHICFNVQQWAQGVPPGPCTCTQSDFSPMSKSFLRILQYHLAHFLQLLPAPYRAQEKKKLEFQLVFWTKALCHFYCVGPLVACL